MGKRTKNVKRYVVTAIISVLLTAWVMSGYGVMRNIIGGNTNLFIVTSVILAILVITGVMTVRKLWKRISGK